VEVSGRASDGRLCGQSVSCVLLPKYVTIIDHDSAPAVRVQRSLPGTEDLQKLYLDVPGRTHMGPSRAQTPVRGPSTNISRLPSPDRDHDVDSDNEYERARQRNIAWRKDMESNLRKQFEELGREFASNRPQKGQRGAPQTKQLSVGPVRRSNRSQLPEYVFEIFRTLYADDANSSSDRDSASPTTLHVPSLYDPELHFSSTTTATPSAGVLVAPHKPLQDTPASSEELPQWLSTAVKVLSEVDGGPVWHGIVKKFVLFNKSLGFQSTRVSLLDIVCHATLISFRVTLQTCPRDLAPTSFLTGLNVEEDTMLCQRLRMFPAMLQRGCPGGRNFNLDLAKI
jgi:hypothetical protein